MTRDDLRIELRRLGDAWVNGDATQRAIVGSRIDELQDMLIMSDEG